MSKMLLPILFFAVVAAPVLQAGCAESQADRRDPRTDPTSAQAIEAPLPPPITLNDPDPLLAAPPTETASPPDRKSVV